jgi:uncharacterized protein YwgA
VNPLFLGGVLKNIYSSFDMQSFENRLKLQKIIYLLQAHGLNLGYVFSLYLYGPYSTELTRDGFELPEFSKINFASFENTDSQGKFQSFVRFIEPHKNNITWLEIAASIHLLIKIGYSEENAIEFIKHKHNSAFAEQEPLIRQTLAELHTEGVLE